MFWENLYRTNLHKEEFIMRTLLSVLLALMLVPALTGCKAPAKEDTTSNKKTTEEAKTRLLQI